MCLFQFSFNFNLWSLSKRPFVNPFARAFRNAFRAAKPFVESCTAATGAAQAAPSA